MKTLSASLSAINSPNDELMDHVEQIRTELLQLESRNEVWRTLCLSFNGETMGGDRLRAARVIADVLYESDGLFWRDRINWCESRDDYRKLFAVLGIEGDKWQNTSWLVHTAKLSPEEGGIGKHLEALLSQLRKRSSLATFKNFRAWMNEEEPELTWTEKVEACKTPEDFMQFFRGLGIQKDEWKNTFWLRKKASLPKEEGGVGLKLGGLPRTICKVKGFKGYKHFVAWVEGKEEADMSWAEKVASCKTPQDFLTMFTQVGIPGDKWKTPAWLNITSRKPEQEGGVGKFYCGVYDGVRKDDRWPSYKHFVAWMEGKDSPESSLKEQILALERPEEFYAFFASLNVPGERWRQSNWWITNSKLPQKEGGAGRQLSGIRDIIIKRFGSYAKFVAWMDGKEEPDESMRSRVEACSTPEHFLHLFRELGIPGEKWKEWYWIADESKKPVVQGGVGRTLYGLLDPIKEQFGTFRQFVAWMEGKERPDPTWKERVEACSTPEEFYALFSDLGIPGERWKSSVWLGRDAKKSLDEGGIEQDLSGFLSAISNDSRFKSSFVVFKAWINGAPLIDSIAGFHCWIPLMDSTAGFPCWIPLMDSTDGFH